MSSPVDRDFDERTAHLPPRSREHDPIAAVLEAADRIKRQSTRPIPQRPAPPIPQRPTPPADDFAEAQGFMRSALRQRVGPHADDIESGMGEIVRANWRPPALEPVMMAAPPKQRINLGPSWGVIARVLGAVGFAAAIALFVAGGFPLPSVMTPHSADRQTNGMAVAAPSNDIQTATVSVAEPRNAVVRAATVSASTLNETDQRIVGASPAFASTGAVGVVAATSPAASRSEPAAPAIAPPSAPASRALESEEIGPLVKRGQELVAQGDIAGGRLLLTRAAEAGDGQAAHALAGTYDADVLGKLRVIGVFPNDALARAWYEKAAALGVADAGRRLAQMAERRQ